MADSNIKRVILKKSELPGPIGNNTTLDYSIRYRIISEDQNRYSHWSQITTLEVANTNNETGFDPNNPDTTSIPHNVSVDKNNYVASISWTMPSLLIMNPTEEEKFLQATQAAITEFDVYVQWEIDTSLSDWVWVGKSTGTTYSLSYPHGSGGPDYIKFRIQKVTIIKAPFDSATYLISDKSSL
jgi:hypothetical protein